MKTNFQKSICVILVFFQIQICPSPISALPNSNTDKKQSIIIEVTEDPHKVKAKLEKSFPLIEVVAVYDVLFHGLGLKAEPRQFTKLMNVDFIIGLYPAQTYITTGNIFAPNYNRQWFMAGRPQSIKQGSAKERTNQLTKHMVKFVDKHENQSIKYGKVTNLNMKKTINNTPATYINIGNSIMNEFSDKLNSTPKLNNPSSKQQRFETAFYPEIFNNTHYTGKGIKVAVIDTGIDLNHPDLKNNYRGGYDLVDLDDKPMETTKEQGMPTTHGTHVAGIIAANGNLKGVAPEAQIYAYRALGPGGVGSSIQVIAAMEQAMKDGVDIMNLSLGNSVNGPDYPTSKAVQKASELGVAVIVANGNDGPNNWTIGAPATASRAFSVGAYEPSQETISLFERLANKTISLRPLRNAPPWDMDRDYRLTMFRKKETLRNRIVLFDQDDKQIVENISFAKGAGAIAGVIHQKDEKMGELLAKLSKVSLTMPLAILSKEDGEWLKKQTNETYYELIRTEIHDLVANFSSRGPVATSWDIKPNVLAPGVNIVSTVPGGYDIYSGTSMATPHVAGAFALLKEAEPKWSNEQIAAALATTAHKLYDNKQSLVPAHIQGNGLIDIHRALHAEIMVANNLLSFGKVNEYINEVTIDVTFYNVSDKKKKVTLNYPRQQNGLQWTLPMAFTIDANSERTVPFTLKINRLFLDKGIIEGWLTLEADHEKIQLPYLFINETDTYKKVAGFTVRINQFQKNNYSYELYVAEKVKSIKVQLYDPETLLYEGTLLKLTNVEAGKHADELKSVAIPRKGQFYGLIVVQLESGEIINEETLLYIP